MVASTLHTFRRIVLCASIAGAAFTLVGCADMVSTSHASRKAGVEQYTAGNYADAAGSFRNAVRKDPRDYKAHYYLGSSYAAMGSYQQAIHEYTAALNVMNVRFEGQEDPKFRAIVLDGLAQAIAKGEDRTADVSVPGGKKSPAEDLLLTAKVHRYSGDADAAIAAYDQAALMDPKSFWVAKDYGLYLEQLGQGRMADPQLRRAYALDSTDEDVAAALRRLNVVPGPSLKDQKDLVNRPVPKGPIPPVDMSKIGLGGGGGNSNTGSGAAASPSELPPPAPSELPPPAEPAGARMPRD